MKDFVSIALLEAKHEAPGISVAVDRINPPPLNPLPPSKKDIAPLDDNWLFLLEMLEFIKFSSRSVTKQVPRTKICGAMGPDSRMIWEGFSFYGAAVRLRVRRYLRYSGKGVNKSPTIYPGFSSSMRHAVTLLTTIIERRPTLSHIA